MRNKANLQMAELTLTAGQKGGYERKGRLCDCGNKAN